MANAIFNKLLKELIDNFTNSFINVSEGLFKNQEDNNLIYPGEFGLYREAICKRFLKFIVPQKLSIDTVFLINSNDEVSTQCDIIIYQSSPKR